ncbi:hypothetical protein [Bordetella hinzii]|uniref:hypothetical protein n=1 Tax=Bordetella hinzii TaxID=103855 RepID=UPI000F829C38|nr:hypothetical protein [Bordetella hinzii]MBZ0074388.1 hypothetical protein [Bordetella hinzii]MBZ0080335.1 hypothetical protein [Bordetella hinzii]MBZ0083005.1 hypothetical protein [Bordetella hinzii]QET45097.1 hypothetical protein FOB29_16345 [Bordetella hinzii]
MKNSYINICRLIASSGYSTNEIFEFLDELIIKDPSAAMKDIHSIRKTLQNLELRNFYDIPRSQFHSAHSDTITKIEHLLIDEAGIPKFVAIQLITEEIKLRHPNIDIPPESRKGFRYWIQRLTSYIPEKELLHIAMNIRNRSVHDSPSDWRLK